MKEIEVGCRGMLGALFVAWVLGAALPAAAQPQPFRYEVALEVPDAYRKLMQEHLELYTARDNPRMNAEQLRFVLGRTPDRIRELLATEGYYSPRIETALVEGRDAWTARVLIVPGEPSRVAGVSLELRGALAGGEREARLAAIRERWPLRAGEVFRQAQWEAAKRSALQVLLADRYPAASIASSEARVDPRSREVSLQVVVESGPAFTFGTLDVQGLERYPRSLIEGLNDIEPGSAYSQAKLVDLQARLQDSRYFSSALVSAPTDPASPERVPVTVLLEEAPSRKLGFGIGASTNTGARGQIEYEDLNLLGRAWRSTNLLRLETKKQLLSSDLHLPRAADGHLYSLTALAERTDIENQEIGRFALGARRARTTGNTEKAYSLQFQQESEWLPGMPRNSRKALFANRSWTRRAVDNLLYPADGFLLSLQLGGATRALLSDQDFLRGHARAVWYRSLGRDGGLILRGEVGATLARSRQGIPSDFLFRAGGDQSVRGYAYQSLGVKSGNAVVGGRYLGVASAEYVHWVRPAWGAAVFYDVGNAADDLRGFKPVHGYGVGARWKSPIGLLNVDLAYGQAVRKPRLHFSVGVSF